MRIQVSASRYTPPEGDTNNTRGFASVKFQNDNGDEYMLERITIRESANGMYVSLPTVARNAKVNGSPVYDSNGNPKKEFTEVLHPVNNAARTELCNAIMERWRANDREYAEFNILGNTQFEMSKINVNLHSDQSKHLVGIGSVTFGDAFKLDSIMVKEGSKGEFLDLPSYRTKKYDPETKQIVIGADGQPEIDYRDLFHPNTREAYDKLTNAVLDSLHAKQQAQDNSYAAYEQQQNNYNQQSAAAAIPDYDPFSGFEDITPQYGRGR